MRGLCRLLTLALVSAFALAPAASQQLVLELQDEVAQTNQPIECQVAVAKLMSSSDTTFDLLNSTRQTSADYLIIDLLDNGRTGQFTVALELPPESWAEATIDLHIPAVVRRVRICKNRPGGVTEMPEPVASIYIPLNTSM